MRLDQLPPSFRGQGVRIAVIDSGAAPGHPNLGRIRNGFDFVNHHPDTWTQDILSHGSHCAGVIAGADPSFGIRGFAPDAEIHVCKLFPGGQISQLIEALEYCIEHQIDVVNLSLGGTGPSPALEQQILRAKRAGVACIAAAGNSGGPVQYPAASPQVLAVTAIGKIDEFPRDSYHVETVNPDVDAQGYVTARFSCFGPQVDVCAPGVGIVSSVPPNNFAAWDGTSMAAPHVTGLAALMLAHHPEFQGQARMRSAERVERLFQLIRMSARRVSLADPTRIGFGLPDAPVALGLAPGLNQQAFQSMLGSLLGGMPVAVGAMPDMARRPLGTMAPFGFAPGTLRPQGW
jgi:subtilisin family serine protease